ALIKTEPSVYSIPNISLPKCIFHGTTLSIASLQNCKIAIVHLMVHFILKNGASHKSTYVTVCHGTIDNDFIAIVIGGPIHFVKSGFVLFNNAVGSVHDILRRTIVLLQTIRLHIIVILLEIQNVVDICP